MWSQCCKKVISFAACWCHLHLALPLLLLLFLLVLLLALFDSQRAARQLEIDVWRLPLGNWSLVMVGVVVVVAAVAALASLALRLSLLVHAAANQPSCAPHCLT